MNFGISCLAFETQLELSFNDDPACKNQLKLAKYDESYKVQVSFTTHVIVIKVCHSNLKSGNMGQIPAV